MDPKLDMCLTCIKSTLFFRSGNPNSVSRVSFSVAIPNAFYRSGSGDYHGSPYSLSMTYMPKALRKSADGAEESGKDH